MQVGIDEIVFDDSHLFYNQQEINITNVKEINTHTDNSNWYKVDDETNPILVLAFTQSMYSTKSIRIEESILSVLARIGGIMNVLNKGCTFLILFIVKYVNLAKQL